MFRNCRLTFIDKTTFHYIVENWCPLSLESTFKTAILRFVCIFVWRFFSILFVRLLIHDSADCKSREGDCKEFMFKQTDFFPWFCWSIFGERYFSVCINVLLFVVSCFFLFGGLLERVVRDSAFVSVFLRPRIVLHSRWNFNLN